MIFKTLQIGPGLILDLKLLQIKTFWLKKKKKIVALVSVAQIIFFFQMGKFNITKSKNLRPSLFRWYIFMK